MAVTYKVSVSETKYTKVFKSINKAKKFIVDWAKKNNKEIGEMDIDKDTILWNIYSFSNPEIQFEKVVSFNQ